MENRLSNQKIVKNSIAGVIRVLIVTPILFFIVPFTLKKLGIELYGIWALGGVVISFAQLSDLGMGSAIIRFVAQYLKNSDSNAINELINTTIITYMVIGSFIVIVIILVLNWIIINIFRVPSSLHGDARVAITGALLIFLCNLLMGVFTNMLVGFQRIDLSNIMNTLSVFLQSGGTFITLSLGWGIKGLVISNFFAILCTGTISIIIVRKIFPALGIHPRFVSFRTLKTILSFSLQIQAASLIALAFDPFIRILITNFSGLSFLSYYDIANKLISNVRSVFMAAITPLLPASAEISTGDLDKSRVIRMHYHSERYLLMLAPIMFFLSSALMPYFISLWIGKGYGFTSLSYQVMAMGWLLSLLATPAFVMFAGLGFPKYQIFCQLILTISTVVLGFLLGNLIGYMGIIIGSTISLTLSFVYIIISFARLTRGGLKILPLRSGGIFVLLAGVVSILIYFISKLLPINYISLVIWAGLGVAVYIISLIKFHIFIPSDIVLLEALKIKRLISKFVPGIRS